MFRNGGHRDANERLDAGGVESVDVDAIAFATGLHVLPAVPDIPGMSSNLVPQDPPMETPAGLPSTPPPEATAVPWHLKPGVRVIHSSQYKKREEFKDRKVLILGVHPFFSLASCFVV